MRQELKEIEKLMTDAVAALKERFKTLRTGRANLGMLDGITVSAYGTDVPLNQVANLSVPEPTLIVAAPWKSPYQERRANETLITSSFQSVGARAPQSARTRKTASAARTAPAPGPGSGARGPVAPDAAIRSGWPLRPPGSPVPWSSGGRRPP